MHEIVLEFLAIVGAVVLFWCFAIVVVCLIEMVMDSLKRRSYKTCRSCGAVNTGYRWYVWDGWRRESRLKKYAANFCPACGEELEGAR